MYSIDIVIENDHSKKKKTNYNTFTAQNIEKYRTSVFIRVAVLRPNLPCSWNWCVTIR